MRTFTLFPFWIGFCTLPNVAVLGFACYPFKPQFQICLAWHRLVPSLTFHIGNGGRK